MLVLNVVAVVVLYRPDQETIKFWRTYVEKGEKLIAIVNLTDDSDLLAIQKSKFTKLIVNIGNLGLAVALNQGLQSAKEADAAYVLLLDQDSKPPVGMGQMLADELKVLQRNGQKFAAIGPTLLDRKGGGLELAQLREGQIRELTTIATSGTIIDMAALQIIGNMQEDLFIDGIDHEWCHRARSKGYRVGASTSVTMPHDMGDDGIVLFGRYRPLHRSPFRHYYIARNTLRLAQLKYIPRKWRAKEVLKLLYRVPVYILNSNDRIATVKSLFRAFHDWRI